jgi:hypothetical protein
MQHRTGDAQGLFGYHAASTAGVAVVAVPYSTAAGTYQRHNPSNHDNDCDASKAHTGRGGFAADLGTLCCHREFDPDSSVRSRVNNIRE